MTSLDTIYSTFLKKVEDDDWDDISLLEDYKLKWRDYLDSAISQFKFPRTSLEIDEENNCFSENLSKTEIQIIADYMKVEWLSNNITTWEKIKTDYSESDFSQANLLKQIDTTYNTAIKNARKRESNYYRSINGKPFKYRKLAGGKKND